MTLLRNSETIPTAVPTDASRTTDDIRQASHILYDTDDATLGTALAFDDPTAVVVGMPSQIDGGMVDAVSVGVVQRTGLGRRVGGWISLSAAAAFPLRQILCNILCCGSIKMD